MADDAIEIPKPPRKKASGRGHRRSGKHEKDSIADGMYVLTKTAMGLIPGGAERLLEKLTDEERERIWDKAQKNVRVVMAGLYPLSVRTLRRIMLDYSRGKSKDPKAAGAAAARVLDFMKIAGPLVVVNNNTMKVSSRIDLPEAESGEVQAATVERVTVSQKKVEVEILPEERRPRFSPLRAVPALSKHPEPERLELPPAQTPIRSEPHEELSIGPTERYRPDE